MDPYALPTAPEAESWNPAFSRLSLMRAVWKWRIRIILAWLILSICAVGVVRSLRSIYLAESVVLIDSQKIPEKFVSTTVAADLEERIASIRQQILSGGELKKIIDEFSLYSEERKSHVDEEILDMMRSDISITLDTAGIATNGASRSNRNQRPPAFRIGYQGRDPALVARVANRLTDRYVEQNLKTRESEASGTSEFIQTQLREAKVRLDEMEAAVSKYKLDHNGELPQQEQSLSASLSRLQTMLEANRDAINRAQQLRIVVESNLNGIEATFAAEKRAWDQLSQQAANGGRMVVSPEIGNSINQRKPSDELKNQLAQARGKFTDNHPEVIRLRAAIEKLDRAEQELLAKPAPPPVDAAKATTSPTPPAAVREPPEFARTREQIAGLRSQMLGADQEIQSRKADQQRILNEMQSYQRREESLPIREQEMAKLTRDYQMSKDNYKSLLDKKMAAEMSLDMERRQQSERFIILDRAQVPDKPIKPKRPMLYAGGLAASLLLGLLLGIVGEFRKNVILGEWELPPDTAVLARLPHIAVQLPTEPAEPKPRAARGWSRKAKLASDPAILDRP